MQENLLLREKLLWLHLIQKYLPSPWGKKLHRRIVRTKREVRVLKYGSAPFPTPRQVEIAWRVGLLRKRRLRPIDINSFGNAFLYVLPDIQSAIEQYYNKLTRL